MVGVKRLNSEAWSSVVLGDIHTNDQQTPITQSATGMHSENFYLPPATVDCGRCAALKDSAVGRLRVFKSVISNAQMS